MEESGDIVTVGVHEFPAEVLVEVTSRDEDGYLVVRSYQFDYGQDGLVPAEPVPEGVEEAVESALTDEGYEYTTV